MFRKKTDLKVIPAGGSFPPSVFPTFGRNVHTSAKVKSTAHRTHKCTAFRSPQDAVHSRPAIQMTNTKRVRLSSENPQNFVVKQDKVEEVRKWLQNRDGSPYPLRILLLTGPTGCGKNETVKALCQELKISLVDYACDNEMLLFRSVDGELSTGQMNQVDAFEDFLFSVAKKSLGQTTARKVALIKEMPNAFIRNPMKLKNLLDGLKNSLKCDVIFSLTQVESCWELNPCRLISPAVANSLSMYHVKFPAIGKREMTALVKKWSAEMNLNLKPTVINDIKEKADGDMRSARSMLGVIQLNKKIGGNCLLHGSDLKTEYLHFMGQVIHAKRLTEKEGGITVSRTSTEGAVPPRYARKYRPKYDLGNLSRSSNASGDQLIDYVAEYKPEVMLQTSDLAKIHSDLALAATISNTAWKDSDNIMDMYVKEIVIFSSFYHTYGNSVGKFMSLRKPRTVETRNRVANLKSELNDMYPTGSLTDLTVSVLPYLKFIPQKISNAHERALLTTLYEKSRK